MTFELHCIYNLLRSTGVIFSLSYDLIFLLLQLCVISVIKSWPILMVVNNYLAIKNDNVFVKIVFNSIFHENADLHNNYYRYLVGFGLSKKIV